MRLFHISSHILLVASVSAQVSQALVVYSLASFDQSQATSLSPACSQVYNADISGCSAPDFLATNPCSSNCIAGLTSIQTQAQEACANDPAPMNSMLGYFTAGQGVKEMCISQKAKASPTTLITSAISSPTGHSTTAPLASATSMSPAALESQAAAGQTGMSLPQGTIIAIVVAVVVAVALLAVVFTAIARKSYK